MTYATSNGTATAGSDYTALPATTVSFAAGQTTKPVSVTVAGDTLSEGHETFSLVLSAPVGATVSDATGVGTIQNDDGLAYLSVNDVVVTEGNSGTARRTSPSPATATRTARRTSPTPPAPARPPWAPTTPPSRRPPSRSPRADHEDGSRRRGRRRGRRGQRDSH